MSLDFSHPGKPSDNAFIKTSGSKRRNEYLNAHVFLLRHDRCEKLEGVDMTNKMTAQSDREDPHGHAGKFSR